MGGAAGHMNHPFDLGWVSTGNDLIDFFDRAKTFVEKRGAGAVKIDGVNVSFKVVGDEERYRNVFGSENERTRNATRWKSRRR